MQPTIVCLRCGKEVRKTGRNQKRCKKCAREHWLEWHNEHRRTTAHESTIRNQRKRMTDPRNRKKQRISQNACNWRLKIRVLSHYGKGGKALCSWRRCTICDLDVLSLDHIKDDGQKHRAAGFKNGVNGYRQLERLGYPKGFQTLCMNHQWKKEILRRKKNRT